MSENKSEIIEEIARLLHRGNKERAREMIQNCYPHSCFEVDKRTYTLSQKMEQFLRDGFIDRYTGQRLLNPGVLKIFSTYFPEEFPYDPHWKMTKTHIAYWEMVPTLDHIIPIARGGEDTPDNWATTSMKNNSIKNNYTLEDIQWQLYPKGDLKEWDGLTKIFVELVDNDPALLQDVYIKNWYMVSKKALAKRTFAKQELLDFATKWSNKFTNSEIDFVDLVDHDLADDCESLGFKMDCGKSFSEKYGKAVYDSDELQRVIHCIVEIDLLGSAIYSRWRYFNHWAYDGREIIKEKNRKWFLLALNRLKELASI